MRKLHLTVLIAGGLLSSCNQKDSTTKSTTNNAVTETVQDPSEQETQVDSSDKIEGAQSDSIKSLIAIFKTGNSDKIASKINFPLKRQYPIPSIKNNEEFKKRFNQVFDKTLLNKIANSTIDQWSEVGWRGTMLDNGIVWMANSDGMISSITYQSDIEKELMHNLIAKDKQNLHASVLKFERPTYKIETPKYHIRIDELADSKYRYASWKKGEKENAEPSLILDNGVLVFDGSGGNHVITFTNKEYTYKVYRNIIGEKNTPDITLEIEKDGKNIAKENGQLIKE